MSSLGKNCLFNCLPIFNLIIWVLLLSYMSSLCILDINPLSDTWLASIFFPIFAFSFCLSFLLLCRNFLIWCSPICLFWLLLLMLLVLYPQNCLPRPVLLCFSPICSSRGFMIFSLTFKSLTHFEFFSEWCETGFQFHCLFFACEYLVFPTPFIYWRDYILPCEYYWLPCQVLDDHICMRLFHFTIKENHTIYRKISNCEQMF